MQRFGVQSSSRLVLAALVATLMGCGSGDDSTDSRSQVLTTPATVVAAPVAKRAGEHVDVVLQLAHGQARPGENVEVRLSLHVAPLWEIGALGKGSQAAATRIDLDLPDELSTAGEWDSPETIPSVGPDAHPAYAGDVVFRRMLKIRAGTPPGAYEVRCRVAYQVCNDRQCLQPEAVVLSVPLQVD